MAEPPYSLSDTKQTTKDEKGSRFFYFLQNFKVQIALIYGDRFADILGNIRMNTVIIDFESV
jgi:hypothetical protein